MANNNIRYSEEVGQPGILLRRRQAPQTHRALAELRKQLIKMGPEDRLPSERALIERWDVSRVTLRRAIGLLKREGQLRSEPGRGYFRSTAGHAKEPAQPVDLSLALALTDIDVYNIEVVKTVVEEARGQHIKTLTHVNRHGALAQIEDLRAFLRQPGLRGLIANPPLIRKDMEAAADTFRELQRSGIHVVFLNAFYSDVLIDSVSFDDEAGMAMATRHLLDLGHRRLAFVGEEAGNVRVDHRMRGFSQALAAGGLAGLRLLVNGREDVAAFTPDPVEAVRRRGVTGFLALNEWVAFQLWKTLTAAGLEVPRDVSIVGFDRLEHIHYGFPWTLTSVRRDRVMLGRTAFRLLWSRCLAGQMPGQAHQHILLPTAFVPGALTGRPAQQT